MNKYKKLALNTVIVGIGTFSSKVLVFLLVPIYTNILSPAQYGDADLISQTATLLIPIITLDIADAVIRFGLDNDMNSQSVFSTGILTNLCGYALFLVFYPIINMIGAFGTYLPLLYIYVLTSSLHLICTRMVRAKQMLKLFAIDGFLNTLSNILLTILFLMVFKWGVTGYLMAIIVSDVLSTIFLMIMAKLYREFKINSVHKASVKKMLRYSVPLIPTTIFWWITNISDRYMIKYMVDEATNGLYTVAYKIPTAITLVSTIFHEAWQISAVKDSGDGKEQGKFFTNIFNAYQAIIFLAASGVIMCCKFFTQLLVADQYYVSWQYVPLLVMATTFSCFVQYLGSIYMVAKRNMMSLVTTATGAIVNVVLNFALIPMFEAHGAAFATFVSCFTVFVMRMINTRKFIKIKYNIPKMAINVGLLMLQCMIIVSEMDNWLIYQIAIFAVILLLNIKMILLNIQRVIPARFLKKRKS